MLDLGVNYFMEGYKMSYTDHKGTPNVPVGVKDSDVVEVVYRDGTSHQGVAELYDWQHDPTDADNDIVAYKVIEVETK